MKKLLLISSFTILFLTSLYFLLRNDGLHAWTKEFKYELLEIVEPKGFHLIQKDSISAKDIPLKLKTKLRRYFYPDNNDKGTKFLFKQTHTDTYLICYMRSAGDHVKAFYFEYHGIDKTTLDYFKSEIAENYVGYEVDWIGTK